MEIVFLLIPLALLFLAGAIAALFWALRKDQFDDLVGIGKKQQKGLYGK